MSSNSDKTTHRLFELPFARIARRWLRLIESSPDGISFGELVRQGEQLFIVGCDADTNGRPKRPGSERGLPPMCSQLLEPILHRASREAREGGYSDRSELANDVLFLAEQFSGPPSRRQVFRCLAEVVADSRRGKGGAVLLVGGSGFGKTFAWRTVHEQVATLDDVGAYHKCPQSGTAPYGSVAAVLDELLLRLAGRYGETPERLLAQVMDVPGPHEAARGVLPSILAAAGLLDRQSPAPGVDYTEALAVLIRTVASRVDVGAVTIVADDVQWADEQSLGVLHRVAALPGNIALVTIGRDEASERIATESRFEVVHLPRLTSIESQRLLDFTIDRYVDESERLLLSEWVATRAEGMPLHVVNMTRSSRQTHVLGRRTHDDPSSPVVSYDHLDRVSRPAQRLVQQIALLFPPVALPLVEAIPVDGARDVGALIREAEDAALIVVDRTHGVVSFQHDSIETSARHSSLQSNTLVGETVDLLWRLFESGDDRATFSIARMVNTPGHVGSVGGAGAAISTALLQRVGVDAALRVLHRAAQRAIELLIPDEAMAFALRGLTLAQSSSQHQTRLTFHTIAHHAAFLLDDVAAMSRHFVQIKAHADRTERNAARNLWVERCYAKLWIRGALQIGTMILRELRIGSDTASPNDEWTVANRRHAQRFFRRRSPRSLFRAIVQKQFTGDRRSELLVRTCVNVMIATMTLTPDNTAILAWFVLDDALTRGPTTLTAMGFVMWAAFEAHNKGSLPKQKRLRRYAIELANRSLQRTGDVASHNATLAFAAILTDHRTEDHRTTTAKLRALGEESIRIGGYEAAAHAVSVYGQNLFLRGEPLNRVFATIDAYRRRVTVLGHRRTATSMAKYQQAVESLMRKSENPSTLTGGVCNEDAIVAELTAAEDRLSLIGLHIAKGFNASYDDDPETAFKSLRPVVDQPGVHHSFFIFSVAAFLYGLAAWRIGQTKDGRTAMRHVRRLAHHTPGNVHRLHALKAERSHYLRHTRRAIRLYAKAARGAVAAGYANEAALMYERHADVLVETRRNEAVARDSFRTAYSLYDAWRAVAAIGRVQRKLSALGGTTSAVSVASQPVRPYETPSEPEPLLQQLSEAKRELANTRDSVRLLFAIISDAVLLIDSEARVSFFNPAAYEFVTAHQSDQPKVHESLAPTVRSMFASAVETRSSAEVETQWRQKIVSMTVDTAPTREGNVAAALVIRDVTEHREREEHLIVADRLSLLGMLASSIAHEVGNPNHIVQLNGQSLEILLSRLRDSAAATESAREQTLSQANEILSGIMDGARRIDGVIQQVKEYGRHPTETVPNPVDPVDICERVIRFTRIMVKQYSAELLFEPRLPVPNVRVEPGLIEQALVNLIKNGCEAIDARGGRVSLRLSVDRADRTLGEWGAVCFAVCDQGPGIPLDVAGRITGIADVDVSGSSSKHGGAGLGLSIVRTIVRRHKGTIGFTSDGEYNTITEMRLPAVSSG